MIRTLFTIAVAGFLICAVSFVAVMALGGGDLIRDGIIVPAVLSEIDGDGRHDRSDEPRAERTIPLAATQTLTLDLYADVTYVQGTERSITVSGPKVLVDAVVVEGGRISWADDSDSSRRHHWQGRRKPLKITVTAPDIHRFEINGAADLWIRGYDQPTLEVAVAGSGDVEASGKTQSADLSVAGSGDLDFDALAVTDAKINIAGSGDASLGPTGKVEVSIAGSGDVTLLVTPASLTSDVAGSGDLSVPN